MKFKEYLDEAKGDTSATTFFHEIGVAVFLKDKNAEIDTGNSFLPYFESGKVAAVDASLSSIPIEKLKQKYAKQFNSFAPKAVVNDAKKVADAIIKAIGKPSGKVLWTGPTNDASRLGAADIAFRKGSTEIPVSLKYGVGQLKNLGLKQIGDILLKGVLKPETDLTKLLDDDEYLKYWDGMTRDWLKFIFEIGVDEGADFDYIIGQYLNLDWKGYLRQEIPEEKIEDAENILNSVGGKVKLKKASDKKIRYFCKKAYEFKFGSKGSPEWNKIKEKWFEKIFGSFFRGKEEKINQNLKNFFEAQLSVGDIPMWYAAQGGKKILYIPSKKIMDSISSDLLEFKFKDKPTPRGYKIELNVIKKGKGKPVLIMNIDINVRWKDGQMNGKPITASEMKLHIKSDEWNNIFHPKNIKI